MAAEEHEGQGRDRLDQPEPAEGQRVVGQLVGLEGDHRREGADREGVRRAGADERPELAEGEQGTIRRVGHRRIVRDAGKTG